MGAQGAQTDFQRRVVLTLALVGAYVAAQRVPSFGIDTESIPELAERTGSFALGIRPALSAYLVVEFFAWAVPRWHKLRVSNRGRDVLERASAVVTIILAIFQGFGVAMMLDAMKNDFATRGGMVVELHSPALVMLSMVVGAGVSLLLARLISGLGLLNGFVALTLVEVVMAMVSSGGGPYGVLPNVTEAPLVAAAAFVLPVVATVLVTAKARPTKGETDIDIPHPASSLQAVPAAVAMIAVPNAVFGESSFWTFLKGIPDSTLWLRTLIAVVVGLVLCALLTQPGPLTFVLTNTGMRHAQATRLARAAAHRAVLPAALFVVVLAASDYAGELIAVQGLSVSLALATALVLDTGEAVIARGQGGWVRIFRDPRPQLVAVAARQLAANGFEPRIGTRAQGSLLRAFGSYACSEIQVQKKDREPASELVRRLFAGPPYESPVPASEESAPANDDNALEAGAPTTTDARPNDNAPAVGARPNAFAPPTADEHEKRRPLSRLELKLAILALVALAAPVLIPD